MSKKQIKAEDSGSHLTRSRRGTPEMFSPGMANADIRRQEESTHDAPLLELRMTDSERTVGHDMISSRSIAKPHERRIANHCYMEK